MLFFVMKRQSNVHNSLTIGVLLLSTPRRRSHNDYVRCLPSMVQTSSQFTDLFRKDVIFLYLIPFDYLAVIEI